MLGVLTFKIDAVQPVSALKMAKDMLMADPEVHVIMVVGGYRNGDFVDYTDKKYVYDV